MLVLVLPFCALGKIIETPDFKVLKKEFSSLNKDDLAVFDVKDVIFTAADQINTPWHKATFKIKFKEIEAELGEKEANRLESIVLQNYAHLLVDFELPTLIKSMQDRNIKVIGLTSGRSGSFGIINSRADLRIKRLKHLGIDFSNSFPIKSLVLGKKKPAKESAPITLYKSGVIFTSRQPKDKVLKEFLTKVNYWPQKIIFVDNQIKNIKLVEGVCKELGIEYVGLHYTKVLQQPFKELDQAIVAKKFDILRQKGKWISDNQAKCILETSLSFNNCLKKQYSKLN